MTSQVDYSPVHLTALDLLSTTVLARLVYEYGILARLTSLGGFGAFGLTTPVVS
jgi:hypothetical protein